MTRTTGVSARMHLDQSLKTIVSRVKRKLDTRNYDAHRELASVNMSSRSPTNAYLIRSGEALVCRYHGERLRLMSAQLSPTVWITWDNSCVERESSRAPLFSKVTRMLRVSRMELHMDENGDWFIKCNCGGRENVGIPCACFF